MTRRIALFLWAVLAAVPAGANEPGEYCSARAANVILYLDVTTPFDAVDKTSLIDGVEKIFGSLGEGDRLSIRTIEDAFPNSRRLIDACMPYCESEGFFSDLLSDCTEGVVIDDRRRLQHDIVAAITGVVNRSRELPTSEIIRTLALSASEEYRDGQDNTIFVFSDMIENSAYLPGGQFLSGANSELLSNVAKDRLVPNLNGATVSVFGIGRKGNPDARDPLEQQKVAKITDFWEGFFSLAGASMTWQPNLGTIGRAAR